MVHYPSKPLIVFIAAVHRKNMYDGVDEYYIVIRETGSREEQATQEEIHRKIGKATQFKSVEFHSVSW